MGECTRFGGRTIWNTDRVANIPIFISSPFRDFHVERDLLNGPVAEKLNLALRELGARVVMVDLRWGIDTTVDDEDAAGRRILDVCLAEIDRTRPFFLGLLGDRYGTVSNPVHARWVAGRAGIPGWRAVEGISVTELEFSHAFLWRTTSPADGPPRSASTIVLLRQAPPEAPASWLDPDPDRVRRLRGAVLEAARRDSGLRVLNYSLTQSERRSGSSRATRRGDDERFVSLVVEALLPSLTEHAAVLAGDDSERASHRLFRGNHPYNAWREPLARELQEALAGPGAEHRCIYGPSGCGKSALAVDLERRLRAASTPHAVVYVDSGPSTLGNRSIMVDAVRQLRSRVPELSVEAVPPGDSDGLLQWWTEALRQAVARVGNLSLVVDGIDRVSRDDEKADLRYLEAVPAGVGVLATTWDKQQVRRLEQSGFTLHWLGPLHPHEAADVAQRWASVAGRRLPAGVLSQLGKGVRSPLWVRHAVHVVGSLNADDFVAISSKQDQAAALAGLLTSRAANLPDEELDLIDLQLSLLEHRVGRATADLIIGLLGGTTDFLSVTDLAHLLSGHVADPAHAVASARQLLEGILWEGDADGRLRFAHRHFKVLFNRRTNPTARAILARHRAAVGVESDTERWDLLGQIALAAPNEVPDELVWVARLLNDAEPTDMARMLLYLTLPPESRIMELIRRVAVEDLSEQAWAALDLVADVPLYEVGDVPDANRRHLVRRIKSKRRDDNMWLRRLFRGRPNLIILPRNRA